jgi:hypothetical protein
MLQAQIEAVEVNQQAQQEEVVELSLTDLQWVGGGSGAASLV